MTVAHTPCHFPMNWGSFFKTVDRIRCDKELLDKAQGFADAGNISEEQALECSFQLQVARFSKLRSFSGEECVIPVWLTEQLSTVKLTSLDIITHHWTYALPSNVVAVFMFSFVELLKWTWHIGCGVMVRCYWWWSNHWLRSANFAESGLEKQPKIGNSCTMDHPNNIVSGPWPRALCITQFP